MNALPMFDLAGGAAGDGDSSHWRDLYRQLGEAVERAADAVKLASEAYRAERNPATEQAYIEADRAYDRARERFQRDGAAIVKRIKTEARKRHEAMLHGATEGFSL
jgi:hypothetical protein